MSTDRRSTWRTFKPLYRGPDVFEQDGEGRETLSKFSIMFGADKVDHRAKSLRILAFSDYHEQSIPQLIEFVAGRKAHLILYGGDAIDRFRAENRNLFEELARHAKYGVCAVAGNDDRNGRADITGEKVYAVHRRALILGSFAVVGLEGAPCFPPGSGEKMNLGPLVYPDRLVQRQFGRWDKIRDKTLIIVSHAPPFGVLDMAKRHASQERSIGSKPLHDYLLNSQNAVLCLCGHVHRWGRSSDTLAKCTVVNAATHGGKWDSGSVAEMVVTARGVRDLVWLKLPSQPQRTAKDKPETPGAVPVQGRLF